LRVWVFSTEHDPGGCRSKTSVIFARPSAFASDRWWRLVAARPTQAVCVEVGNLSGLENSVAEDGVARDRTITV